MPEYAPDLVLRLGSHAEKEYFDKMLRFFDGLMVGANLVESTPAATASLFVRFGGRKVDRSVFIDPMTYAFGTYRQEGRAKDDLGWIKSLQKQKGGGVALAIKRSYRALGEALGGPFERAISSGEAITPGTFGDEAFERAVCESVLTYQSIRIPRVFENDPEYGRFVDEVPHPSALFAPYFYIEPSAWRSWLDVVIRLARWSSEVNLESPKHTVICADQEFLENEEFAERVVEGLLESGIDGVWFWFSQFSEDRADARKLAGFRNLVERLADSMEVNDLHGGYYSIALSRSGLRRISHGVGYGEQKNVNPVIGQAIPTVRYYLPDAKRRLGVGSIHDSFAALGITTTDDFFEKVCDCAVCRGVLSNGLNGFAEFGETHYSSADSQRPSQTPAAAKRCRYHYLLNRIKERDRVRESNLSDIRHELAVAREKWRPAAAVSREMIHLDRWNEALGGGD